jgi:hypothetical protein
MSVPLLSDAGRRRHDGRDVRTSRLHTGCAGAEVATPAIVPAPPGRPQHDADARSTGSPTGQEQDNGTSTGIGEESGTCNGFLHPDNGYYASDFTRTDLSPAPTSGAGLVALQTGSAATVRQLRSAVSLVDDHTHPLAA